MYWIPNKHHIRLAIVPRPRGGDWLADEAQALCRAGIDIVVSLLTQAEARELGLEREQEECDAAGITFMAFPIPDRGVPASRQSFHLFVGRLKKELLAGHAIGIHCRQSIGRSSLLPLHCCVPLGVPPIWPSRKLNNAGVALCRIPQSKENGLQQAQSAKIV